MLYLHLGICRDSRCPLEILLGCQGTLLCRFHLFCTLSYQFSKTPLSVTPFGLYPLSTRRVLQDNTSQPVCFKTFLFCLKSYVKKKMTIPKYFLKFNRNHLFPQEYSNAWCELMNRIIRCPTEDQNHRGERPKFLLMLSFIISLVPAKMESTRTSR
jgi:hypothetical protein